jgi:hypothetical protein
MAPRRTASAFLAAVRASSVNGEPVASMEAWNSQQLSFGCVDRVYTHTTKQVVLQIESDTAGLLDDTEDLKRWK